MTNKKIGVLGSGVVGKTLAAGFIKHGYEVMIGTRDPEKLSEWLAKEPKGKACSTDAAATFRGYNSSCSKRFSR
jgi:predicted dinucleotide-binding enzyme